MSYLVIDTNIFISSFIQPKGNPGKVFKIVAVDERIELCYNDKILSEYLEVASREKFKKYNFDMDEIRGVISDIRETGHLVNPPKSDMYFVDESDRIFYDTAIASGATLVTGNMKHYPPNELFIMTASEYVQLREQDT